MLARRPARASGSGAPPPAAAAPPHATARLLPFEPGLYVVRLLTDAGWREPGAGLAVPAVQVCPLPDQDGTVEITDSSGQAAFWLGGQRTVLFIAAPTGGAVLVTGYLARDAGSAPLTLDIRRLGGPQPGAEPLGPVRRVTLGDPAAAEQPPQPVAIDVVAHIHRRGDVRWDNAGWVGRVGPGLSIEGFMVFPHSRAAAASIEYKGLSASGAETPWTGAGGLCGSRGEGVPLIGFAVRQKPETGGVLFDCEYAGYFRSGATAGPVRNGTPCRSTMDGDPLEGLILRIMPRPPRSTATTVAAGGAVGRG